MYKIYGNKKVGGYDLIGTSTTLDKAERKAKTINIDKYLTYMIIEETQHGDTVVKQGQVSKECEVEFVDEIDTDYVLYGTVLIPARVLERNSPSYLWKKAKEDENREYGEDDYLNM